MARNEVDDDGAHVGIRAASVGLEDRDGSGTVTFTLSGALTGTKRRLPIGVSGITMVAEVGSVLVSRALLSGSG